MNAATTTTKSLRAGVRCEPFREGALEDLVLLNRHVCAPPARLGFRMFGAVMYGWKTSMRLGDGALS